MQDVLKADSQTFRRSRIRSSTGRGKRANAGRQALVFGAVPVIFMNARNPMIDLDAFDEDSGHVNAIIDTPKGSRNKFKFDERLGYLSWAAPFRWERYFLSVLA